MRDIPQQATAVAFNVERHVLGNAVRAQLVLDINQSIGEVNLQLVSSF